MSTTILIVDDDEVIGGILSRILTRQGHVVWRAASVNQALGLAREHRPMLALLDLCLPDGDGVELAGQLRAELPGVRMILMTAFPLRLRQHPELAHEFAQVLTKPLELPEFRRVIETALAPCG